MRIHCIRTCEGSACDVLRSFWGLHPLGRRVLDYLRAILPACARSRRLHNHLHHHTGLLTKWEGYPPVFVCADRCGPRARPEVWYTLKKITMQGGNTSCYQTLRT